jgi:5-methylcytosine-specific restriction endonuclease McrA
MKRCGICRDLKPMSAFGPDKAIADGRKSRCRSCLAAYERARMKPHRKGPRKRMPIEEERRRKRESLRRARTTDPESHRQKRREYRASRRDRERAACRAYYRRDPKKAVARAAAYFRKHPERKRESEARRRARKAETQDGPVDYAFVMRRDRMICHLCRKKVKVKQLHFDHVIPLSKGGAHITENVAVAHDFCNLSKHDAVTSLF